LKQLLSLLNLKKTKLDLIVNDEEVEKCVDIISAAAKTGKIGDGKIFVMPIDDVIRIRTGESGSEAV
jgi:nitrogen regulatory protein P-II 1